MISLVLLEHILWLVKHNPPSKVFIYHNQVKQQVDYKTLEDIISVHGMTGKLNVFKNTTTIK